MSRTIIHEGIAARITGVDAVRDFTKARDAKRAIMEIKVALSISREAAPVALVCDLLLGRHAPLGIAPGSVEQPDMLGGDWADATFFTKGLRVTSKGISLRMSATWHGNTDWDTFASVSKGYENKSARDKGAFVTLRFYGEGDGEDPETKDWPELPSGTPWFATLSGIDYVFCLPGLHPRRRMRELLPSETVWVSAMARFCLCNEAVKLNKGAKGLSGQQRREAEVKASANVATARAWVAWGEK